MSESNSLKQCSFCQEYKLISEFYVSKNGKPRSHCKKCQYKQNREVYFRYTAQKREQTHLVIDHLSLKDIIRIFSRIQIDPVKDCWNWTGARDSGGYSHICYRGTLESTHRLMYAWLVEPIPRRKAKNIQQLDHLCRNIKCINPAHLELVTPMENIYRGESPSAQHKRQTHCKRGHLLPKEPNYITVRKNGRDRRQRCCRICESQRDRGDYRKAAYQKIKNSPDYQEWLKKKVERALERRREKRLRATEAFLPETPKTDS